jgi:hypothetical protein
MFHNNVLNMQLIKLYILCNCFAKFILSLLLKIIIFHRQLDIVLIINVFIIAFKLLWEVIIKVL